MRPVRCMDDRDRATDTDRSDSMRITDPDEVAEVRAIAAARAAALERRVREVPLCRVCGRPMLLGQRDTHYSCDPQHPDLRKSRR